MNSSVIKSGFIVIGAILIVFGFWSHSIKKLAVDYAVTWGLLGACMILIGLIPVFSAWMDKLGLGTALAFFCVGVLFLVTEVQESIMLSQLNLKNRELAMQVALLNQENRAIKAELERLAGKKEGTDADAEKALVCN